MPWPGEWCSPKFAQAVIERMSPHEMSVTRKLQLNRVHHPRIAALLRVLDGLDPRVLAEGLDGDDRHEWIRRVEQLRIACDVWATGQNEPFDFEPGGALHDLLAKCPDEPAPAELPRLRFIRDKKLRESIARDVETVGRLLRSEEWKPATIIGGSVVEALLLDRLERPANRAKALAYGAGKKWRGGLEGWGLFRLVEVA